MIDRHFRVVTALGVAQTLAWGSSYYLPAILAAPMARTVGVSVPTIFAGFSAALLVSALVGPLAGRAIDRRGGRSVLMATNVLFAAALVLLGVARGPVGLFIGWCVLGLAMGSGLYEAAFATLVRLYGHGARGAITGVTLIAGFASTVGWPLSTWLEAHHGWRGACLAWAALHVVVAFPLNWSLPRATADAALVPSPGSAPEPALRSARPLVAEPALASIDPSASSRTGPNRRGAARAAGILGYVFAVTWFVSTAMASHLPRLLMASGATLATAVLVGSLVGPAQVAARIVEFSVLRKVHPLLSARLATLLHPVGAVLLVTIGTPLATAFGLLHGAGNGILTIAKGTLPLVIFGPAGYGHRQGVLMVPARIAQALAPWLFGLCLDRWGSGALWISSALGVSAFAALLMLSSPAQRPHDENGVAP